MVDLENIFEQIRKENSNFESMTSKGDVFLPIELLRNNKLTTNEKIYIATFYSFNKDINKTDNYMNLNKMQLWKTKKHLLELGYLKVKPQDIETLKKETIKKSHKGNKCEWCKKESYILQKHHFPIPQKDGGKDIVNICPNCHYTFHKLQSEIYE